MITATAHSEPAAHQRRVPRNVARYLARHAGPLPTVPAHGPRALQGARDRQAMQGADTPLERKAMAELLKIWGATRGYFPEKEMPVPKFLGYDVSDQGSVGYGRNPQGDPVPVGVAFSRNTVDQMLSKNQDDRDVALQTVLHEWAHNFQKPEFYRSTAKRDPVREGGAEGFVHAVAPGVARALGRRYVGAGGVGFDNEYRPFILRLLRQHPVSYFTRGQFGGAG